MTASSKDKAEQSLDEWIEEQAASLRKWMQDHETDEADAERIHSELPKLDPGLTTAQIVPKVKKRP